MKIAITLALQVFEQIVAQSGACNSQYKLGGPSLVFPAVRRDHANARRAFDDRIAQLKSSYLKQLKS